MKTFEGQLASLFQVYYLVLEKDQAVNEHRATKETLAFQLSKLQKDMKEVQALTA